MPLEFQGNFTLLYRTISNRSTKKRGNKTAISRGCLLQLSWNFILCLFGSFQTHFTKIGLKKVMSNFWFNGPLNYRILKIQKSLFKTEHVFKCSFLNGIMHLWNDLPVAIRTIRNNYHCLVRKWNEFWINAWTIIAVKDAVAKRKLSLAWLSGIRTPTPGA